MNNQQIIDKRWKKTEKSFREHLKEVRDVYRGIGDDAIDLVNSLNVRYEDLNKIVPANIRRQAQRKIEKWKEEGIVTGYFEYLVLSLHKYTYAKILEVLIYGLYMSGSRKLNAISNQIFKESARDCYEQGLEDLGRKSDPLSWAMILPLLTVPSVNVTFEQYLTVLNETASDEMYRQMLECIRIQVEDLQAKVNDLLSKQANRVLNVNGDKETGAVVDMARAIGNQAYIMAGGGNQKVKFVAEIDDRTTKMCLSMNDYVFNTVEENVFYRYSDQAKRKVKYAIKGLVLGINMPPIVDHFHWCRSTLTYQTDKSNNELQKEIYNNDVTKSYKKIKNIKELKKSSNPTIYHPKEIKAANGNIYSGDDIAPNSNLHGEEENAEWLKEQFGVDVHVLPEVRQTEERKNVKAHDYLLDDSDERWECKADISGTSRRTFKNNMDYYQATSYLFDVHKCVNSDGLRISDEFIEDMIDYTFRTERYANYIIVKDGNDLIGIYQNRK